MFKKKLHIILCQKSLPFYSTQCLVIISFRVAPVSLSGETHDADINHASNPQRILNSRYRFVTTSEHDLNLLLLYSSILRFVCVKIFLSQATFLIVPQFLGYVRISYIVTLISVTRWRLSLLLLMTLPCPDIYPFNWISARFYFLLNRTISFLTMSSAPL